MPPRFPLRSGAALLAAVISLIVPIAPVAAEDPKPLRELPYSPSLDPLSIDRSADPCVDFYKFSCGGWQQRNPLPADQSSWSVYRKVFNDNLGFLWGLLEEASQPALTRTAEQQKIGDTFASCMDEAAVERAGTQPLAADLAAIGALKSLGELPALLGRVHPSYPGSAMLFGFGSTQDAKNATETIGYVGAGGLGLPDRDYYLLDDAKSKETREKYRAHVQGMLELLGDEPARAKAATETVMRIETKLAEASLSRVDRRDPYKTYHRMSAAELQALTPSFQWQPYLKAIGVPALASLDVSQPEFVKRIETLLAKEPVSAWREYLRWTLVAGKAEYLSKAFVARDFDFNSKYLNGTPELQPRWKRCVNLIDRDLGEALGKVFVEKVFPPAVKQATVDMTKEIQAVMAERVKSSPWMSEATQQQALRKLGTMRNKVGYPDVWRDYSALEIKRGDFMGNTDRAAAFESRRQLAKIGQPLDRGEWGMTPPTVNAYYNAQMNDINFAAGILQPPLYDPKTDDGPNFGNTGSTIGHELIHGFDDEGRKFDADGNLKEWWTAEDGKEFEKRAKCVADQYGQYIAVDDIKINSQLTLGEDIADLGGTILAHQAWKRVYGRGEPRPPKDGLTAEQRFFVGFAQWACANQRPEARRLRAKTDPHSPPEFRINGVVVNMPEFAEVFSCKVGQPMVKKPEEVCRIW